MTRPTDARPDPSAPAQQQPDEEDMLHDRVARDIHDALGWAYTEQEWSQPRYRTKLDAAARAAITAIRALIPAPPPVPSHDPHLSAWRQGVEAAAVVLDALGDHSHDKGTAPGALAALCASQCARHVRDFGAQGRPDLAQSAPRAGAGP